MQTDSTPLEVIHDRERKRFYIALDEHNQAILDYQMIDNAYAYTHTGVPEAFRGRGIADLLAKAALETATAENARVIPLCSFMQTYIRRHTEYAGLVDQR
jgi:predicted GNAT family acetyltransferase